MERASFGREVIVEETVDIEAAEGGCGGIRDGEVGVLGLPEVDAFGVAVVGETGNVEGGGVLRDGGYCFGLGVLDPLVQELGVGPLRLDGGYGCCDGSGEAEGMVKGIEELWIDADGIALLLGKESHRGECQEDEGEDEDAVWVLFHAAKLVSLAVGCVFC